MKDRTDHLTYNDVLDITNPEELNELANHEYDSIRLAVAKNRETLSETLIKLTSDENYNISRIAAYYLVIKNPLLLPYSKCYDIDTINYASKKLSELPQYKNLKKDSFQYLNYKQKYAKIISEMININPLLYKDLPSNAKDNEEIQMAVINKLKQYNLDGIELSKKLLNTEKLTDVLINNEENIKAQELNKTISNTF